MFINDAWPELLAGLATEVSTPAGVLNYSIIKILFGRGGSCEDKFSMPDEIVYVEEPEVYWDDTGATYVGRYTSDKRQIIDIAVLAAQVNGSYFPIMKLCSKLTLTPNSTVTVYFTVLKL